MADSPYTTRETLKHLGQNLLSRLENRKQIEFTAQARVQLRDEVYRLLSPYVLTEEDLTERTRETIGSSQAELEAIAASDTEKYQAAKRLLRERFGDDVLHGFYFQKPLKDLGRLVAKFLMDSALVEEVYASDDDLQREIVEGFQKFNPDHLH